MALREKKKAETKQRISDLATEMFLERGFDAVTVAEIAAAANVAKMTVFNYFARKEDLFFDRTDESLARIADALASRKRGVSPVRALQQLAHTLLAERHPFAAVAPNHLRFWAIVEQSPALFARAREIGGEITEAIATHLAAAVDEPPDGVTRLLAASIVATWQTAYAESLRAQRANHSQAKVRAAFTDLIDRGFDMVAHAARGTPYG